ncbi:MAG: hypothetical protein JXA54_06360 [Candidatus Heimdallarchaeota archaeon]|nr:hypothetical protein [Candidatus Heimdallarchaeota archaeon]
MIDDKSWTNYWNSALTLMVKYVYYSKNKILIESDFVCEDYIPKIKKKSKELK